MNRIRLIDCSNHGRGAWTGEVLCVACGAVWWLGHDDPPTEDGMCTCGKALSGDGGTARMLCHGCYSAKKSQAHPAGPS